MDYSTIFRRKKHDFKKWFLSRRIGILFTLSHVHPCYKSYSGNEFQMHRIINLKALIGIKNPKNDCYLNSV
jgi:hypothetical protein